MAKRLGYSKLESQILRNLTAVGVGLEGWNDGARATFAVFDEHENHEEFYAGFILGRCLSEIAISRESVRKRVVAVRRAIAFARELVYPQGTVENSAQRRPAASQPKNELECARRKRLGGGIDWSIEATDETERQLRGATLASMDGTLIEALMANVLPGSWLLKSSWPSDVRRAYESAQTGEEDVLAGDLARRMRQRVAEARNARPSNVVALRPREPEPAA